jgi:hypothetical protein
MSPISNMMASQSAELHRITNIFRELMRINNGLDLQFFQFVAAGRLDLRWIDIFGKDTFCPVASVPSYGPVASGM